MNATCEADTGLVGIVVGSLVHGAAHPDKVGEEAVLDIQTAAEALEPWWDFYNPGACRRFALRVGHDFSELPQENCVDAWQQQAFSILGVYEPGIPGPNRARLVLGGGVIQPFPVDATTEYLSFAIYLNRQGTTACTGCTGNAVIVLNEVSINGPDDILERVTTPLQNQVVGYSGGITPTRNVTWGQVKGLYR